MTISLLLQIAAVLLLVVALLLALVIAQTAHRIRVTPLRRMRPVDVPRESFPPEVLTCFDRAIAGLAALGFRPVWTEANKAFMVSPGAEIEYLQVLFDGKATFASVGYARRPGPPMVSYVTAYADGSNAYTLNHAAHFVFGEAPGWQMIDECLGSDAAAYQRHVERHAERVAASGEQAVTVREEIESRIAALRRAQFESLRARGQISPRSEPDRWQFTWPASLRLALRVFAGEWRAGRAGVRAPAAAGIDTSYANASHAAVSAAVAADIAQASAEQSAAAVAPSVGKRLTIMLGSALAFFVVVAVVWDAAFSAALIGVIAVHELGHAVAMRAAGYRNVQVFFVPGLGGAAVGIKRDASAWQQLVVFLAGPLPGLLLGVIGLWLWVYHPELAGGAGGPNWVFTLLLLLVAINLLNLLPVLPLDGGRVVDLLLFSARPRSRFAFSWVSVLLLGGLGLWLNDGVVLLVAGLLVLALPHEWRRMRTRVAFDDSERSLAGAFSAVHQVGYGARAWPERRELALDLLYRPAGAAFGATATGALVVGYLSLVAVSGFALYQAWSSSPLRLAHSIASTMVPDDVARPTAPSPPARDFAAELAQSGNAPAATRISLLVEAARNEVQPAKGLAYAQAAWALAESLPVADLNRADAMLALAEWTDDAAVASVWLTRVVSELRWQPGVAEIKLADALQRLDGLASAPPNARVDAMNEVIALRSRHALPHDHQLQAARRTLVRHLYAAGRDDEALVAARQTAGAIALPASEDRSPMALHWRLERHRDEVSLAQMAIRLSRFVDAELALNAASRIRPASTTMSWVAPELTELETAFWLAIAAKQTTQAQAAWLQLEAARSRQIKALAAGARPIQFDVDRLALAQLQGDKAQQTELLERLSQARKTRRGLDAMCPGLDAEATKLLPVIQQLRSELLASFALCAATTPTSRSSTG